MEPSSTAMKTPVRFRAVVPVVLLLAPVPGTASGAQQDPDPGQPRPPLLLEASRTERLETAVRMYLAEFIGAIQRADTVALASLVPDEVIPDVEKPVAARAGCPSLGVATARLRAARAGESPNPVLPLAGVVLGNVNVRIDAVEDTVARIQARIMERRRGRVRYAPIEILFGGTDGSWEVVAINGILVGACGMALEK